MGRIEAHVRTVLAAAALLRADAVSRVAAAVLVDAGDLSDAQWRETVLRHMLVKVTEEKVGL